MNDTPLDAYIAPTLEEERERFVPRIKLFRKDVDELIQRVSRIPANCEASGKEIVPDAFGAPEATDKVRIHLTSA